MNVKMIKWAGDLMVNIEYKTEEEQIGRTDFNPKLANSVQIDKDMIELSEKYRIHTMGLYKSLKNEHFDEEDVINHMHKIINGVSGFFEKQVIYDTNVKAIDELKLSDFKYENNFRNCLEHYYYISWYSEAILKDKTVLDERLSVAIAESSINIDDLMNFVIKFDKIIEETGNVIASKTHLGPFMPLNNKRNATLDSCITNEDKISYLNNTYAYWLLEQSIIAIEYKKEGMMYLPRHPRLPKHRNKCTHCEYRNEILDYVCSVCGKIIVSINEE